MIVALTGFQNTDRDWAKDMLRMVGAHHTSYFSSKNHAIVCRSPSGQKYEKAKEWRIPTVTVQWLNEVMFGNMSGPQSVNNPKFSNFKVEDQFKIDYALVPHLMNAWKVPIRVTPVSFMMCRKFVDYIKQSVNISR